MDKIINICLEALEENGYDCDFSEAYQRIIVNDEVSIEFGEQ